MINIQSLKLDVSENKIKISATIDSITPVPIKYTSLSISKNDDTVTFTRELDATETISTYNPEKPYYFNIQHTDSGDTTVEDKTIITNIDHFTVADLKDYLGDMYNGVINVDASTELENLYLADIDDRMIEIEDGDVITYQLGSVTGMLLDVYNSLDSYEYEIGNAAVVDKFADCYFKNIYIDTQDTFVCTNEPSTIASEDKVTLEAHCKEINPDTNGNIDLSSFIRTFDAKNDMFFVFLEADPGNTDMSGWTDAEKQTMVVGIIFSKNELQKNVFSQIKNVACQDRCNTTCQDVLPILWYKAFQLSGSGDLIKDSIKYWNLIHQSNNNVTTNNCSCNG